MVHLPGQKVFVVAPFSICLMIDMFAFNSLVSKWNYKMILSHSWLFALKTELFFSCSKQDSQPLLPSCGVRHELIRSRSLTLRPHQCEDPWKSISGSSESNQFVHLDSTVKRPVLIDVQGLQIFIGCNCCLKIVALYFF